MARKRSAGGGSSPATPAAADVAPSAALDALLARAPANLFATTLDAAADSIAICDAEGRITFANAAARQWTEPGQVGTGTTLEQADEVWGDWYTEDGRKVAVADWPMTRALRGETVLAHEMYKRSADGERHHMLMSASPVRDANGAVLAVVCTAKDISARKLAEEQVRLQLERSQQLLNDVINHSNTAVFLKDLEGRYLLFNGEFASLFGIDQTTMLGKTDFELLPHDTAVAVRANDALALASGEPLQIEELIPAVDGLRTYLSVKFPLRDRDGRAYGVAGIATDITERKRVEAALERSQATLSAIIESSIDPIWAVDRDLHMVAFNQIAARQFRRMYEAEMGAHGAGEAVPRDVAERWLGYLRRALGGERFVVEEAVEDDGITRRFLVSLNPTVEYDQVTGVAVFGKDITDLRRAEEQARQHQAELAHALRLHTMGEMAASLAHEVNQPLGAIANYAQGCRRRIEAGELSAREMLPTIEAIAREALRAGEITRRVREVLRKEDVHHDAVDVALLVATAAGLAQPTAARLGVEIHCAPVPPLPGVLADPIQIEQVLLNLLLNAVEASVEGAAPPRVDVQVAAAGPELVEFAVSDTGLGIDAALGERIFEPFLTTKPGGLGMGLAISRSIIDAHGGRLWVTAGPAGGAVFHFTLPAGNAAKPAEGGA